METQTIDQGVSDARASLMESIADKGDWNQYKDNGSEPSSPAAATSTTPTQTDARSESDASEQVTQATSPSEKNGVTNEADKAATNRTDNVKPRAPARIQELLDKDRASQARIAELEKQVQKPATATEAKAQEQFLIPQPTPPQYGKDVLAQLLQKAKAEGDQKLFDSVQEQFEQWRVHELKMIEWKIDHKEATTTHNQHTEYYRQEALKKWEALKDPNSEHTKQYVGVRGWINKEVPDALKKPVSEYFIAQIANWKMAAERLSPRLAASDAALKKANEEIEKLKKGSLPLDSKTRTEAGSNDSVDHKTRDAKQSLMKSIQAANLGFGSQTM